ncbi:cation diffusion facilitator transporter family protein, partial [Vibrio parahaemolyticus V-223/04]
PPT